MKKIFAIAAILALPTLAMADNTHFAIGAGVGTTGVDAALTYKLSDNVNLRGIVSGLDYSRDGQYGTQADYNAKFKLFHTGVLGDFYPFSNGFRLTGGVVYNNTKLSLNGKPAAGSTYTINGTTYNSTDVGNLNGEAKWDKPAIFLGLGYGNAVSSKGFSVTGDLGVLLTDSPSTTLSAQCGSAIAGTPTCTQLQSDVAADQRKFQDDANKFKYWPVARVMVNYGF
ncbi:hypothetical protein [Chromobacterium haemolyticum]|uniref:hypothetical protein n=1 Tax=Chromobacterium haemolyticum TaxID=394935 RepID=UPI002447AEF3|nr:hypothetical protein [Chromobacterium haemolyticum]MDH0342056.1 hypothetical protein [Chromobacterium haemolyticum]